MCRGGRHRWWGWCVFNYDDFSESAIAVDLLNFAVADSILMCAFPFASGHWWGGHAAWTKWVCVDIIERLVGIVAEDLRRQVVKRRLHRLSSCERRGG